MHKIDSEWITRNDRGIVPRSTVQGYVQKGFFYKCLLRNVSNDLDNFGLLHQPVRIALATRVQMSNLPPLLLPVIAGEYVQARISYVASFDRLFVQLANNARTIINVGKRLRELAKQRRKPLCNPECGTVIAALYPADRCYYRASICSKAGIDSMIVFYIDYGNMASVNISDAFLLEDADLLSVPPQAVQLIMEDVKKPRLTAEQIKNLLIDQTISAQINNVSDNEESFIANLFVKDEKNRNINLTEVILGERPAPALPVPKSVTIDNCLDSGDDIVDYKYQRRNDRRFENRRNRDCENDYKMTGPGKQNRGRSSSSNFCGNISRNFNDYSSGSSLRRSDSLCHNCGEPGHLDPHCSVYRRSGFAKDRSSDDSGRRRFVDNDSFTKSRFSSKGIGGPNDSCYLSARFGEPRRDSFEDRSVRPLRRRDQSPHSFLDHGTHRDDTTADKSGWKSGDWVGAPSTNMAESEKNCFFNGGFEKKVDKKEDAGNWIVNEASWDINNSASELVDNNGQIEASEGTSKNPAASSACNNFDDAGDAKPTPTGPNVQLSPSTLSRIESASLEEIKFGDTVGGLRSDDLAEADPLSFFVQLDRDKNKIEHLVLSDAQLPVNLPKLSSFEISQACIAHFMGYYYRAEIIGEESNEKKRVFFVDYGSVKDMDTSMLYVINNSLAEQFYTSRRIALHCRLHGVMPVASRREFDPKARKLFSELTANQNLSICFLQQSVKDIYEVTIMLSNGLFVSDILIVRGFAVPFKWGIGPPLPLYETLDVLRSDECDHVHPIFTVQLSDNLALIEQVNNGYVDCKKTVEVPRISDVVISYFEELSYRAEIIAKEINGNDTVYRVRFVDYGNESLCTKEELFALDRDQQPDEILYTPRQGIRCRIDGVRPVNHKEEWSEEAQKRIDSLLSSNTFEAFAGSPSVDGVYPIRAVVLKNLLNGEDDFGTNEVHNVNDKIDLANWLIAKGYAEMQDIWRDYPVKNLLADGEHEYGMFITEVDGQIIRARPCALANIKTVPLVTDTTIGLISLNNENKRAVLVSSANDEALKKYLLVDEGICVEERSAQFSGLSELYDSDGFLVRTCHRLSVQLRFTESLLDEKLREVVMGSAGNDPVKVILFEYSEDSYLISDILFSDSTTLIDKLEKAGKERIGEKELASDLVTNNLEQTSGGSSSLDEAIDLKPLNIGMKQTEHSENLITDQDPNFKSQV
uniref:CCHC-type domain-containing protein n=1 Tax=Elaeophora elaphi TaxID=1147741 RepID=A0A0R3S4W9_9BILA